MACFFFLEVLQRLYTYKKVILKDFHTGNLNSFLDKTGNHRKFTLVFWNQKDASWTFEQQGMPSYKQTSNVSRGVWRESRGVKFISVLKFSCQKIIYCCCLGEFWWGQRGWEYHYQTKQLGPSLSPSFFFFCIYMPLCYPFQFLLLSLGV